MELKVGEEEDGGVKSERIDLLACELRPSEIN